jgi:hypothetical protein
MQVSAVHERWIPLSRDMFRKKEGLDRFIAETAKGRFVGEPLLYASGNGKKHTVSLFEREGHWCLENYIGHVFLSETSIGEREHWRECDVSYTRAFPSKEAAIAVWNALAGYEISADKVLRK